MDAFYGGKAVAESEVIASRLAALLAKHDPDEEAILGQECRSLIAELREDFPAAIHHRIKEIAYTKRLWSISRNDPPAQKAFVLRGRRPRDLSDRFDLLAVLYHDSGQLKKAIRTLWKSRELCEEHGVKFDGAALLRDYLKEYRAASKLNRKA